MKIHIPYDGVSYLEPYQGFRVKILMKCTKCEHEWKTTPQTIQQSNKKFNLNGCPECNYKRRYAEKQAENKAKIPPHIEVISEWNGSRNFQGVEGKVLFRNTKCGHEFESYPSYIIAGKTDCTTCGDIKRTTKRNINNSLRRVHDPKSWKQYQNDCHYASTKVFEANLQLFNPSGQERTVAGVEGGYQLDHILPKAVGYKLNIPYELISHIDNLQFIPWEQNRGHGAKLKGIPAIFDEYKQLILEHFDEIMNDTETT